MERNSGKRRPETSSQGAKKSSVSGIKTRINSSAKRVNQIFSSLKNTVPPLRDVLVVVAVTAMTFTLGFFAGRGIRQSVLPGDFVSIQEIDIQGTSSSLADVTEDFVPQDIPTRQIAEAEATPGVERDTTAPRVPDKDTGVAGPAPTEEPEAKSQAPRSESAVSTPETMVMPVQGRVISDFGWRKHPVYQDWRYHTGIDIGVAEGSAVRATLSGKVADSGSDRELGLYIVIEHPNGIKTKYAHLASSSVNRGDSVRQGQTVGKVGTSGVTSGPHLHFEVISGEKATDPEGFL